MLDALLQATTNSDHDFSVVINKAGEARIVVPAGVIVISSHYKAVREVALALAKLANQGLPDDEKLAISPQQPATAAKTVFVSTDDLQGGK